MYQKSCFIISNEYKKQIKNWTNAELAPYLASPQKAANLIYGPEGGNNGEGYKYRGRGFTQITFKDNYNASQKLLSKYKINKNLKNKEKVEKVK